MVITGAGLISPLGNSKEAVAESLAEGRSGVGPIASLPAGVLPTSIAAEADQFDGKIDCFGPLEKAQKKLVRKNLKVMCRECQMGVAAAQLALTDAGITLGDCEPMRGGVVYGSDYMMTLPDEFCDGVRKCVDEEGAFEFSRWAGEGMPQLEPLWLLKYLPNMPASHIAIFNDLRGPNNSITQREASSNLAVGEACCIIRRGGADMIVAGATGTRVHPNRTVHVAIQEELASGETDPATASRPFDRQRSGMVLGEGAGAVILEELTCARQRGATILGEIVGYGSSSVTDQNCIGRRDEALANVLQMALGKAEMKAEDLGHVHAHGLATRVGDQQEARGLQQGLGEASSRVPVTAAKSYFGNLGAGGGVVELIVSLLASQSGRLPPILNYDEADPECPVTAATGFDTPAGESFVNLNVTPQGQASSVLVRSMA